MKALYDFISLKYQLITCGAFYNEEVRAKILGMEGCSWARVGGARRHASRAKARGVGGVAGWGDRRCKILRGSVPVFREGWGVPHHLSRRAVLSREWTRVVR